MLTVTAQVAFFPEPSAAVAVMVAVPLATAVTRPVALTVATLSLLLLQVTFLLLAFSGRTVAVSWTVAPAAVRVASVWFSVTLVAIIADGAIILNETSLTAYSVSSVANKENALTAAALVPLTVGATSTVSLSSSPLPAAMSLFVLLDTTTR